MKPLPIAETFLSIQGEGTHTGRPMVFIRLAGCNVGQYLKPGQEISDKMYVLPSDRALLENRTHSVCVAADGQQFCCDTDYHRAKWSTISMALAEFPRDHYRHVCVTGGEPLLHGDELFRQVNEYRLRHPEIQFHMETSGTLPFSEPLDDWWVTCSPKIGFLAENHPDEFKLLCGPEFNMRFMEQILDQQLVPVPVYLQPIQGIAETDQQAFQRCIGVLNKHPEWILSAQLHKFLQVR